MTAHGKRQLFVNMLFVAFVACIIYLYKLYAE